MAIKYQIEIENFDSAWLGKFVRRLPHFSEANTQGKEFLFRKDRTAKDIELVIEPTPTGMIMTIYDFEFGRTLMGLLVELLTGEKGKISIDEV